MGRTVYFTSFDKEKNGEYWMRGDHNRTYELVIAEDIIGIVEQVRRNGGESIINCRSLRWRVCSYCWMKSFPVHRWLLGLLNLYAGLYRNKKVKEIKVERGYPDSGSGRRKDINGIGDGRGGLFADDCIESVCCVIGRSVD